MKGFSSAQFFREVHLKTSNVELYLGTGFTDFWPDVIKPWFEAATNAWQIVERTVVLVPDANFSFFLRSCLHQENLKTAGVYILTPQDLRRYLADKIGLQADIISRENLHLLMSSAAEANFISQNPAVQAMAEAIAAHPAELVQCLDKLTSAGWEMNNIGGESLTPIVSMFESRLKKLSLKTVQQIDSALAEEVQKKSSYLLNRLIVIGFNSTHWSQWNFLKSAVKCAPHATVCLSQPRVKSERCDQVWIGSWEQEFAVHGEIVNAGEEPDARPFFGTIEMMESNSERRNSTKKKATIRVGKNLKEQAAAVFIQAIEYLNQFPKARIGVVFPARCPISREIGSLFSSHGILFDDGLGFTVPVDSKRELFHAWLNYEKSPGFKTFFSLLDAMVLNQLDLPYSPKEIQKVLKQGFQDVLVDDLSVIANYLSKAQDSLSPQIALWLKGRTNLPQNSALFKDWIASSSAILNELRLATYIDLIKGRAARLPEEFKEPVSKSVYLSWLSEVSEALERTRSLEGGHPYSHIHLLTYAQAVNQQWTHLILTSLNDGQWPATMEDSGFLSEKELRDLNDRAIVQGKQGEGHSTVRAGKGFCLGGAENRNLTQNQFYNLIESVSEELCLTASWSSEEELSRTLNPSHLLTKWYTAETGKALTKQEWDQLSEETSSHIASSFLNSRKKVVTHPEITRSYQVRRNPELPFGEYEFSLKNPLPKPVTLACKAWQDALTTPALVWMKSYLGVSDETFEVDADRRALTTGEWLHRWMRQSIDPEGRGISELLENQKIVQNAQSSAASFKSRVESSFVEASMNLPMWWTSTWNESIWKTRMVIEQLSEYSKWKYAYSEWSFPRETRIAGSNDQNLEVVGRIDLFLSDSGEDFKGRELHVFDYKTGNVKDLTLANIQKGRGVQIILYALGLEKLGASSVKMTFLKTDGRDAKIFSSSNLDSFEEIKNGLIRMQNTGVFGMLEEVRPEHVQRRSFPYAVLPIEKEILASKWELTHDSLKHIAS